MKSLIKLICLTSVVLTALAPPAFAGNANKVLAKPTTQKVMRHKIAKPRGTKKIQTNIPVMKATKECCKKWSTAGGTSDCAFYEVEEGANCPGGMFAAY